MMGLSVIRQTDFVTAASRFVAHCIMEEEANRKSFLWSRGSLTGEFIHSLVCRSTQTSETEETRNSVLQRVRAGLQRDVWRGLEGSNHCLGKAKQTHREGAIGR